MSNDRPQDVADAIDALGADPTPNEVYHATRDYDARYLASAAASEAKAGGGGGGITEITSDDDSVTITADGTTRDLSASGGGSVPGSVRRLTFDVTAADLDEGPVTLYEPEAGEVVGPVYLYDVVFCNGSTAITIGRDEQVDGDTDFPALAGWDSDLSRDGMGMTRSSGQALHQCPLTTGDVTAGFTTDGSVDTLQALAWQAGHVYAQFATIIAAGTLWSADPGGTSGGSKPDFAGNKGFGNTVTDNGITWTDGGVDCSAGSATVSMDVCTPDDGS